MSMILDIIIVLLFVGSIIMGAKNGFIKSVLSIVVMIIALYGSYKLYDPLSEYINEKYLSEASEETETEDTAEDNFSDKSEETENKLQAGLEEILGLIGSSTGDSDEVQSSYVTTGFLTKKVSDVIAFSLIYSVISIVLTVIMNLVNLAARLPIIRQANTLLGLFLGFIRGLFYAWGISYILCIALPRLAIIYNGVSENVIDDTVIVKILGGINIFNLF